MYDLSKTLILSIEITDECNLKKLHSKCPASIREKKCDCMKMDTEMIVKCMYEAKELNFNGYIAFHFYNEPLLEKEAIIQIVSKYTEFKYLLWTNGLLLDRTVENNTFLKKIDLINISCYDEKDLPFFLNIKNYHGKVHIFREELDDRINSYSRDYLNQIGCKRPLLELPINYFGDLILCCHDWNNSYKIGNLFESSLREIVMSESYQNIMDLTEKRLLNQLDCPDICRSCNHPLLTYANYLKIYE